ncbi:MAG: LysM peptidoglycan-binding domain-containing protein, partial [Deinococcales bacterium]
MKKWTVTLLGLAFCSWVFANTTVTVQKGDSLGTIAARYGTTVAVLQRLNGLDGVNIRPGQVIKLPSSASIRVQSGDSLQSIAARHGISVEALRNANGISSDRIRVGQTLRLPSGNTVANRSTVVEKGDTVGKIAKRFGISVEALQAANRLEGNSIRVGQTLVIPAASRSTPAPATTSRPSTVVVQQGDTLEKIAQRNNVSLAALRAANSLTSDVIRVGDVLRLAPPTAKPQAAKPSPTSSTAKPSKPSSTAKPSKPSSTAKPAPTSATRLIAPPPNLPNATGRVITVAAPKPTSQIGAKPSNTPASNVAAPSAKPVPALAASSQRAPKPIVVTPPSAKRPSEPDPSVSVRPAGMPSTLGFSDPLEAPSEASVIDPSLESPYLDTIAPSGIPTAPSDLIEDVEIEIPENLSASTVKPPVTNPSKTTPSFSRAERVLWPLSGTMTSRFGWRRLRGNRFHTGIDLAAPTGTRVYAALSGRVEFAGWNRQGYGYLVIIRGWDNRQYYYGHNSRILVKRGAWVRQGQIISRVGSTGFSTGT